MRRTSRVGIGRAAAAVAVIVIIVLAAGVGIALSTRGPTKTSTSVTSATSSTQSSTTVSTTSTSVASSTSSTTSSTTTSSSIVPVGCVFSPPPPFIAKNTTATVFTGCLTPGASGVYLIGVADPNGVVVQGVIRTEYASQITIAGVAVGNLTAAGNGATALSGNDTTVLSMPNLVLFGDRGYGVTVVNQSGQNDTVTMIFNLIDEVAFVA